VAPRAGVAEPGARRPRAERGNLKAPEVTQLNYRLTTKLHRVPRSGAFICRVGLPNLCAGHAAYVVGHRRNNALEVAPGLRSLKSWFDVSPGSAFCVTLASALAILDMVCLDIETEIIAPKSIFVVLPLAHAGLRRHTLRQGAWLPKT